MPQSKRVPTTCSVCLTLPRTIHPSCSMCAACRTLYTRLHIPMTIFRPTFQRAALKGCQKKSGPLTASQISRGHEAICSVRKSKKSKSKVGRKDVPYDYSKFRIRMNEEWVEEYKKEPGSRTVELALRYFANSERGPDAVAASELRESLKTIRCVARGSKLLQQIPSSGHDMAGTSGQGNTTDRRFRLPPPVSTPPSPPLLRRSTTASATHADTALETTAPSYTALPPLALIALPQNKCSAPKAPITSAPLDTSLAPLLVLEVPEPTSSASSIAATELAADTPPSTPSPAEDSATGPFTDAVLALTPLVTYPVCTSSTTAQPFTPGNWISPPQPPIQPESLPDSRIWQPGPFSTQPSRKRPSRGDTVPEGNCHPTKTPCLHNPSPKPKSTRTADMVCIKRELTHQKIQAAQEPAAFVPRAPKGVSPYAQSAGVAGGGLTSEDVAWARSVRQEARAAAEHLMATAPGVSWMLEETMEEVNDLVPILTSFSSELFLMLTDHQAGQSNIAQFQGLMRRWNSAVPSHPKCLSKRVADLKESIIKLS